MSRDLTLSQLVQGFIETEEWQNTHDLSLEDRKAEDRTRKIIVHRTGCSIPRSCAGRDLVFAEAG
jgi:hypothetical protein